MLLIRDKDPSLQSAFIASAWFFAIASPTCPGVAIAPMASAGFVNSTMPQWEYVCGFGGAVTGICYRQELSSHLR